MCEEVSRRIGEGLIYARVTRERERESVCVCVCVRRVGNECGFRV